MAQQGERAVADQVDGRLVAGHVEQHDERQELLDAQPVARLLGHEERRQHVVAEVGPSGLDHLGEVGDELGDRRVAGVERLEGGGRFERGGEGLAPVADLVGAVLRQVEQVGDHLERHREGQFVDELHLAPLGRPVEHGIDLGLDAAAQRVDRRRGERLADEPPQAGVVGRIEVEDRLGTAGAPGASPFEDRIVTWRGVGVDVAAEVVAAQRARHVVVPGDDRQADRRHVAPATRRAAGRRTGTGSPGTPGRTGCTRQVRRPRAGPRSVSARGIATPSVMAPCLHRCCFGDGVDDPVDLVVGDHERRAERERVGADGPHDDAELLHPVADRAGVLVGAQCRRRRWRRHRGRDRSRRRRRAPADRRRGGRRCARPHRSGSRVR